MYNEEDNDSYRAATEGIGGGVTDDNRTATGTIKSYRKTPYTSRYTSKVNIRVNESFAHSMFMVFHWQASVARSGPEPLTQWNIPDLEKLPADEHRLLLHDLFARLITDPQMGLTFPQVSCCTT